MPDELDDELVELDELDEELLLDELEDELELDEELDGELSSPPHADRSADNSTAPAIWRGPPDQRIKGFFIGLLPD